MGILHQLAARLEWSSHMIQTDMLKNLPKGPVFWYLPDDEPWTLKP